MEGGNREREVLIMRRLFLLVVALIGAGCQPKREANDTATHGASAEDSAQRVGAPNANLEVDEHLYAVYYGYEYSYQNEAGGNVTSHQCVCGFIDSKGETAIPPVFDSASEFSDGVAAVSLAGIWGFMDRTGRFIFDPVLLGLRESCKESPYFIVGGRWFSEGRALFRRDGKSGFFDKVGHIVVEPRLDLPVISPKDGLW